VLVILNRRDDSLLCFLRRYVQLIVELTDYHSHFVKQETSQTTVCILVLNVYPYLNN
jgi:hypothetical protein